jgi:hypothetical protein
MVSNLPGPETMPILLYQFGVLGAVSSKEASSRRAGQHGHLWVQFGSISEATRAMYYLSGYEGVRIEYAKYCLGSRTADYRGVP